MLFLSYSSNKAFLFVTFVYISVFSCSILSLSSLALQHSLSFRVCPLGMYALLITVINPGGEVGDRPSVPLPPPGRRRQGLVRGNDAEEKEKPFGQSVRFCLESKHETQTQQTQNKRTEERTNIKPMIQ